MVRIIAYVITRKRNSSDVCNLSLVVYIYFSIILMNTCTYMNIIMSLWCSINMIKFQVLGSRSVPA